MKHDSEKRRRRSIRLKGYDYGQAGAYFVTVCTQDRACLFGNVADDTMRLNDAGRMIEQWWFELNGKFPTAETDEFVVMPNHFHGIVVIPVGADLRVGPGSKGARTGHKDVHVGTPLSDSRPANRGTHTGVPLPTVIQWFKTMTTNEYIRRVKAALWPSFNGRLWQRNYYEHIIRDEDSLNRIRQYIIDNPTRWAFDRENPAASAPEPENAWLASPNPSSKTLR
jgi:REP element-mobilizing transposase RayT